MSYWNRPGGAKEAAALGIGSMVASASKLWSSIQSTVNVRPDPTRAIGSTEKGEGLECSFVTPTLMSLGKFSEDRTEDLMNLLQGQPFALWNLSGRSFSESTKERLGNQVLDAPWLIPGQFSQVPSIDCIFNLCYSMKTWLDLHNDHVAVIHCQNGRTRSGILIACFLKYITAFETTSHAFDFFCSSRAQADIKACLAPSYRILFENMDRIVDMHSRPQNRPIHLKTLAVSGLPVDEIPCVEVWDLTGQVYISHQNFKVKNISDNSWSAEYGDGIFRIAADIMGDFSVMVRFGGAHATKRDKTTIIFKYHNHTGLLAPEVVELRKQNVDVNPEYEESLDVELFTVQLILEPCSEGKANFIANESRLPASSSAFESGLDEISKLHAEVPDPDKHASLLKTGYPASYVTVGLQLSSNDLEQATALIELMQVRAGKQAPAAGSLLMGPAQAPALVVAEDERVGASENGGGGNFLGEQDEPSAITAAAADIHHAVYMHDKSQAGAEEEKIPPVMSPQRLLPPTPAKTKLNIYNPTQQVPAPPGTPGSSSSSSARNPANEQYQSYEAVGHSSGLISVETAPRPSGVFGSAARSSSGSGSSSVIAKSCSSNNNNASNSMSTANTSVFDEASLKSLEEQFFHDTVSPVRGAGGGGGGVASGSAGAGAGAGAGRWNSSSVLSEGQSSDRAEDTPPSTICAMCKEDIYSKRDQLVPCYTCSCSCHTGCFGGRKIPFGFKTERDRNNREKYLGKYFGSWQCAACMRMNVPKVVTLAKVTTEEPCPPGTDAFVGSQGIASGGGKRRGMHTIQTVVNQSQSQSQSQGADSTTSGVSAEEPPDLPSPRKPVYSATPAPATPVAGAGRFAHMLAVGLPPDAVRAKMQEAGMDAADMETVLKDSGCDTALFTPIAPGKTGAEEARTRVGMTQGVVGTAANAGGTYELSMKSGDGSESASSSDVSSVYETQARTPVPAGGARPHSLSASEDETIVASNIASGIFPNIQLSAEEISAAIKYAKYEKLRRYIPEEGVRIKMAQDGVGAEDIAAFLTPMRQSQATVVTTPGATKTTTTTKEPATPAPDAEAADASTPVPVPSPSSISVPSTGNKPSESPELIFYSAVKSHPDKPVEEKGPEDAKKALLAGIMARKKIDVEDNAPLPEPPAPAVAAAAGAAAAAKGGGSVATPGTTVQVPLAEHPIYMKYFKMLRIGLPSRNVQMKMTQEGLDPAVLDLGPAALYAANASDVNALKAASEEGHKELEAPPAPAAPPSESKRATSSDNPMAAVLAGLAARRPKDEAPSASKAPAPTPGQTHVAAAFHPIYEKFFKMLKVGLPLALIKAKMEPEGADPSVLDGPPDAMLPIAATGCVPAPVQSDLVSLSEHPLFGKYFKMLKTGVPIDSVKNRMIKEGVNADVLDRPATDKMSITDSGPAAVGKVAPKRGPRKKRLYWKSLDANKELDGTLWADEDEDKDLDIDEEEFKKLFVETVNSPRKLNTGDLTPEGRSRSKDAAAMHAAKAKKKFIYLIDMKRGQNASIALSRIKMNFADIRKHIACMQDKDFSVDQLGFIQEYLPTPDETAALRNFKGDREMLGQAEKFMFEMLGFNTASVILDALLFKKQFSERVGGIDEKMRQLDKACNDVKVSKRLKKVMKTILKVGNQMNNDGDEDQKGFSLATLLQLQSAKAFDKKTSILQYVIMLLHRNDEDCLQFPEELAHLGDAAKIGLDILQSEKVTLEQGLDSMRALVAREAAKEGHHLDTNINTFIEEAIKRCDQLDELTAQVRMSYNGLLVYFGEDLAMGSQDFFATLHRFLREFVIDREAYLAHKKREERLAAAKRSVEAGAGGRGGGPPMRRASTMSNSVFAGRDDRSSAGTTPTPTPTPLIMAPPAEAEGGSLYTQDVHNNEESRDEGMGAGGGASAMRNMTSAATTSASQDDGEAGKGASTKPIRRGTIM